MPAGAGQWAYTRPLCDMTRNTFVSFAPCVALIHDIPVGQSLHLSVKIRGVHALWENALIAFPSDVGGAVDVGVHYDAVVLTVQASSDSPAGELMGAGVVLPVRRDEVPCGKTCL